MMRVLYVYVLPLCILVGFLILAGTLASREADRSLIARGGVPARTKGETVHIYPGNLTIQSGEGGALNDGGRAPDGDIVLRIADGREMIRLNHDGRIFVRGEQVDDNRAVWRAFREWLAHATVTGEPRDGGYE